MRHPLFKPALLVCFLASALSAQTGNATISGQVTDATGGVIPGAKIVVKSRDTNVAHTTTTNSDGRYSVPNLIPGAYELTADFQGFKRIERGGIVLQVGDRVALDLVMEVGSTNESVTVTGEVPLLRTEDAQAGLVIDNRRIQELPQYNRNPLAFAQLVPNVNGTAEQGGRSTDFRINGGRTGQSEYIIDGIPVTTGYLHEVPPSVPSREAVAEFKVLTNGLSAEYGRLSGGAVLLVTRSGTNDFHGSAYEFFRNDKLNANDWNSNRFGRQKGVFHDNVFGGTMGGPVRIPKVFNGRDRTFFFLNYEGVRRSSGSNSVITSVPTELERQGDFSQSLIDQGKPVRIYDALTGRVVAGHILRDAFPGNRIPETRFDTMAKLYLPYYPKPNQAPRPNSTSDSNYIHSRTTPSRNNRWTGRVDQNWNAGHASHFSITQFDSYSSTPRTFSALESVGVRDITAYTVSLEHSWTVTPATIVNFRGGLVRQVSFSGSEVDIDTSNWPLQKEVRNLIGTTRNRAPSIAIDSGPRGLGGGSVQDERDTNYTGAASVQKLAGKHTFKAGYEHRRYFTNVTQGGSFSMSTNRIVTAQDPDQSTASGSPFASWLLGGVIWGTGEQLAGPASLQTYHGVYLQDDVKLTKKLTINAGMRWDYEPPRTERYNRQLFWDRSYQGSWKPNADWSWNEVMKQVGANAEAPIWLSGGIPGRAALMGTREYPGRTLVEDHPFRFGPRVGIAWQFLPRTVLRASYGMSWLTLTGSWFLGFARWNTGYGDFARLAQGGSPDGGLTYPLSFTTPMPGGSGYIPFTRNVGELNQKIIGNWFVADTSRFSPGYEHVLQLGIQREIGSGQNAWVLELNYSGNLGRGLPMWIGRAESTLPDAYHKIGMLGTKLQTPVPNPFYGQIPVASSRGGKVLPLGQVFQINPLFQVLQMIGDPLGTSNYHAGYAQAEHRFGHGFTFLANYTWAKLLQDVGGVDHAGPIQGFPQAGLGLGDIYGVAPTDIRHKLLFNYAWDIPLGRGKAWLGSPNTAAAQALDKLVGGWVIAGTTTFRTGNPIQVTGSNMLWFNIGQASNEASERPVFMVPRAPYDPHVSGHTALEGAAGFRPYTNRDAFRLAQARPDRIEIGDAPSALTGMRAPAFSQWDLSLLKNIGLGRESRYLQLRFEAQNLLNHMNAGKPNGNITARSFGMITGQVGSPRQVIIAAKINF